MSRNHNSHDDGRIDMIATIKLMAGTILTKIVKVIVPGSVKARAAFKGFNEAKWQAAQRNTS